ncbi:hypothetical protein JXA88_13755 [Candidatus Fermentibacteria bacterium]|nr:hypothetical protein [Candidatus Fermentibacteria bacterium]
MRAGLVVAGIMMVAAVSVLAEEEWPLRLEEIWQTPGEGEEVFAEGFPPPEIKAVLADTSIPQEDKEWLLNQIRHWAAYRTKQLWLDDGTTMDIPAVRPGDKVRSFTVYASRNMKYWLVRVMRIEGPEVPPEPAPPPGGGLTPEFGEAKSARLNAQWQQKAHWREVYMDVEGRIYWEKEFGPYNTHLEYEWYGDVVSHISDDGEVVVKIGARRGWFCGKAGECVERNGFSYLQRAALSADGSTFVVHTAAGPYDHRVDFGRTCGLRACDESGELKWASEAVPGGTGGFGGIVDISPDGSRAVFTAVATGGPEERSGGTLYVVDSQGKTVASELMKTTTAEVVMSADGSRMVAVYRAARLVHIREASTGRLLWEYRTGARIAGVGTSREGEIVAIVEQGGSLTILSGDGVQLLWVPRPVGERYVSPIGGMGEAIPYLSPDGVFLLEKAVRLQFSRLVVQE